VRLALDTEKPRNRKNVKTTGMAVSLPISDSPNVLRRLERVSCDAMTLLSPVDFVSYSLDLLFKS
jgi:hypothetical protein